MTVKASLIGINEKGSNHPGGGRYPAFRLPIGLTFAPVTFNFRFMKGRRLLKAEWWLFHRLGRQQQEWERHPYAFGLLMQELQVWWAMRRSPGHVFHSVKGETDIHHLPRWSRGTPARLVVTYHDSPEHMPESSADFYPNHDGVVALCEGQRRFLIERGVAPERARVVYHGVDTARFVPSEALSTNPTVISVGSYFRDHWTMNGAMERVLATRPDVEFLIVGTATAPKGMEPDKFDHPRVRYIDGISDAELVQLYHRSSIAAIPVKAATANNALLEAMSCGLPVIATDTGGLPEYLGDEAGILVPPRESEPLADAILRLLDDRELAVRMGKAGRKRAVETFDYAVVAAEMLRFYEDVARWPQAPAAPVDPA